AAAAASLGAATMVVTLSPFKANMDFSDVLLPIAPFTETSGSFVNAEGRLQSFLAVVKPGGEARPAWKVLRVLANTLGLPGFEQESSRDVLALLGSAQVDSGSLVAAERFSNHVSVDIDLSRAEGQPCVASIYQLDSIVRRAPSLQLTADACQSSVQSQTPQRAPA
ncbi:MAG: molybdopterin-dependent oxidoreductase, partial [Burkholderiaceae bacterium]